MKGLVIDVETSFIEAAVWSLWDQGIPLDRLLAPKRMICWAAKWTGKKGVIFRREGDKDYLTALHKLLEEADFIVTYNGKKFDIKHINKAFLMAGMKPPAPCQHVDVLATMKARFAFDSNKLQHVSEQLGVGSKEKHEGFKLWVKCLQGDEKAWAMMKKYNIKDVTLLEDLYNRVKGWIKNHPSHAVDKQGHVCPNCGSNKLQKRGYDRTKAASYDRYACMQCGSWHRTKSNNVSPDNRKNIPVSI
jgi:hypothetical protein